jgi:hypothetical protein
MASKEWRVVNSSDFSMMVMCITIESWFLCRTGRCYTETTERSNCRWGDFSLIVEQSVPAAERSQTR